jgi:hypothetical protein
VFESFFEWIEATGLARAVGESLSLTAWLSAVHIVGFTLAMGAALVANLRMLGLVLPHRTAGEIVAPASRAIMLGLIVSMTTGALLFSPRAASAAANGTFQLKMLLLLSAATFHFAVAAPLVRSLGVATRVLKIVAATGLALWIGLALAACAFILFE